MTGAIDQATISCSDDRIMRDALDLADRQQIAEIETGARPDNTIIDYILRQIVRKHPTGTRLEAAITDAITLAWRARHELQLIRENR